MLASRQRQSSKSTRRIRIKSPLGLLHKISLENLSQQKKHTNKSNGSTSGSNESGRKVFTRPILSLPNGKDAAKKWPSTEGFKNKIYVSSCQFNRLRQKLQSTQGSSKNNGTKSYKMTNQKKLKIKILLGLNKLTSNNSQEKITTNNSSGSSDSEQIEMLKVENEYFKKIYDQALRELSKLKNKLKQEKKVHEVEKQIYENEIKKLKRIVDTEKQVVSHIICDDQNRCIILVSSIDRNCDGEGTLGLDSDCEDNQTSIGSLSIQSK